MRKKSTPEVSEVFVAPKPKYIRCPTCGVLSNPETKAGRKIAQSFVR